MTDNAAVRSYWDDHIHDLEISSHSPGSREFFADLDQYHFEKLHHLPRLIDFNAYRGKQVLDVGCGAGTDLVRFAKGEALVKQNFAQQGLAADLREADGEQLPFDDNAFDLVFAHGVVQYTARDKALVDECRRVLRPGGTAVFQVYNRVSWLNGLSKVMKVPLEHEDAPVLKRYSAGEFRSLLTRLSRRAHRRRTVSRQVAAARRVEGHAVQRVLRRDVQRASARVGAPLWLAPARLLHKMSGRRRGPGIA